MKLATPLEQKVGMKYYWNHERGTGGILRSSPEDFVVQEIIEPGIVCPLEPNEIELPGRPGLYVHCIMKKRLVDHFTAERALRKYFKITQEDIGAAGIKDTVAITSQRISIWIPNDPLPKEPISLLGNTILLFGFQKKLDNVYIGDLHGNRFTITVRQAEYLPENLGEILSKPKPNYYGIQRFGERRPISHLIGKHLLLGEYAEAVRLFLCDTSGTEPQELKQFRRQIDLDDVETLRKMAEEFPRRLFLEKQVLKYLSKHPEDYQNALKELPHRLLYLQVYAFQSYLFNQYLSIRLESDPFTPISGEIIGARSNMVVAPIPGGERSIKGEAAEIYEQLLAKEGMTFSDLKPPHELKMKIRRIFRELFIDPARTDAKIISENSYVVRFDLLKGQYATSVLREIMQNGAVSATSGLRTEIASDLTD